MEPLKPEFPDLSNDMPSETSGVHILFSDSGSFQFLVRGKHLWRNAFRALWKYSSPWQKIKIISSAAITHGTLFLLGQLFHHLWGK